MLSVKVWSLVSMMLVQLMLLQHDDDDDAVDTADDADGVADAAVAVPWAARGTFDLVQDIHWPQGRPAATSHDGGCDPNEARACSRGACS